MGMTPAWHVEARALRAADPGRWTIRALAAHFGKSRGAVGEVFKRRASGVCTECGGPTCSKYKDGRCRGCLYAAADVRRTLVEGMWAAGWTGREIVAAIGATQPAYINAMRSHGWDLPYRRPLEHVRRIRDARWGQETRAHA